MRSAIGKLPGTKSVGGLGLLEIGVLYQIFHKAERRSHRDALRPRVRAAVEASLEDTLGAEDTVLVMVDPTELPRSWASIDIFAESIGEAEYRVTPAGDGHAATAATLRAEDARGLRDAASALREQARITLGDRHLDAKLFPHLHPHGTGSLRSEESSGGMHQYAKNRLISLDARFRSGSCGFGRRLRRQVGCLAKGGRCPLGTRGAWGGELEHSDQRPDGPSAL